MYEKELCFFFLLYIVASVLSHISWNISVTAAFLCLLSTIAFVLLLLNAGLFPLIEYFWSNFHFFKIHGTFSNIVCLSAHMHTPPLLVETRPNSWFKHTHIHTHRRAQGRKWETGYGCCERWVPKNQVKTLHEVRACSIIVVVWMSVLSVAGRRGGKTTAEEF